MGIKDDPTRFVRLKREECKRTKHDSAFSDWKILIGPSDWENYLLRKEGVERYRNHNLPLTCSCPGLYELGVASTRSNSGRDVRKLDQNGIIVVYLGQADNIRSRLQDYGRAGSHLDRGKSTNNLNADSNFVYQRGPGLFKEIFSKGFPIVFRWASLENKKEAEKTETQLLRVFDYAWNTGGNGARRPNDILLKLDKINSSTSPYPNVTRKLQEWLLVLEQPFIRKKSGIRIKSVSPVKSDGSNDQTSEGSHPRVFKFGRTRPRLVSDKCDMNEEDAVICGVSLGDGSVCRVKPVRGRKRCEEHKGKRIIGCVPEAVKEDKSVVCGVNLEDGSRCIEIPVQGRKRCELHKGMKISTSRSVQEKGSTVSKSDTILEREEGHSIICGVFLSDASVCSARPIDGRKRCELHKGMNVCTSINVHEKGSPVSNSDPISDRKSENEEKCIITCGVLLSDGSICNVRPIGGRKRCGEHKGQRANNVSISKSKIEEINSVICGVGLGDGYVCTKNPVKGRKRCEMHKGRRITPK
ncbi:hypothetical protein C5167_018429 [Papaver somniferum]|uniref:GIY-YIG domain-containing protein n=1 Tax=Papaver somniferum TaxID=3469 RepID=A0A4Y7IRA5_PAPSO|nr:protein EFFECTOR OF TRANSCRIPTION 2-like [Papaver somniferum]RZC50008.1 hypothetical protein C5167_018429 [Papaver somniferum]